MRNIFKTFKENKALLEENKLLKAQNEALAEFRKSFDNYYNDVSGVRVITRNYDKKMVLSGSFSLDRDGLYCPIDVCKECYRYDICRRAKTLEKLLSGKMVKLNFSDLSKFILDFPDKINTLMIQKSFDNYYVITDEVLSDERYEMERI